MELTKIFYEEDIDSALKFIFGKNLAIEEMERSKEGKRQFKLIELPTPTDEELKQMKLKDLREQRSYECFSVINRGKLWYDKLSEEQINELRAWYHAWLDVTETKIIPQKPEWLE